MAYLAFDTNLIIRGGSISDALVIQRDVDIDQTTFDCRSFRFYAINLIRREGR